MHFVDPSLILPRDVDLPVFPFFCFFFVIRMVDDLHQLVKAAGIATPFILVGSELGALNGRFYTHIYDS